MNSKMLIYLFLIIWGLRALSGSAVGSLQTCNKDHPNACMSLNGLWNISLDDLGSKVTGVVPGGIYSDLMRTRMLEEIYLGNNDQNFRWLSKSDWNYSKTFKVSRKILRSNCILLTFDGIDTFATIHLNGKLIGETYNMFVRYSFPVKKYLKHGTNHLQVKILSPIDEARRFYLFEKQNGNPLKPECQKPEIHGECYISAIRKQQISFGSDLSPAFPNLGIWQNVHLEYFSLNTIRTIQVKFIKNVNFWILQLSINLEGCGETTAFEDKSSFRVLTSTLFHHSNRSSFIQVTSEGRNDVRAGHSIVIHELKVPNDFVDYWWPNGYGEQILYTLTTSYWNGHEKFSKSIKIGFRTVQLVEDGFEGEHIGYSFYFKINNVSMFMKGANWAPIHILPEIGETHAGRKTIYKLLKAAKWANMNMIRVWGGGVYQTDFFYTTCDELGLLVWQDFMFTGAIYPLNDNFIKQVKLEVDQQVRRLQHHPSIALWVGNDEMELGIHNKWFSQTDCTVDLGHYRYLFDMVVKEKVLAVDKTRSFLYSTPSNGQDIYVIRPGRIHNLCANDTSPGSSLYGDSHSFPDITDIWNPFAYDTPRFVSEYGLQSYPSYQTMQEYSNLTAWTLNSTFAKNRQHFEFGEDKMQTNMQNIFEEVPLNDTKRFIYLSQILQAVALKIQTEAYRRVQNRIFINNQGLTMGSLIWHLNDVWPAPTWSTIGYFKGRWKMAHYYSRNMFAPLLVSGFIRPNSSLEIFVINDFQDLVTNVTLRVKFFNFKDLKPLKTIRKLINIMPLSALMYLKVDLKRVDDPERYNHTLVDLIVPSIKLSDEDLKIYDPPPSNFILMNTTLRTKFEKPNITLTVIEEGSSNEFLIQVRTDKITMFVWIQSTLDGYFSDNGFIMSTVTKTIIFYPYQKVKWDDLEKSLNVSSLGDTSNLI